MKGYTGKIISDRSNQLPKEATPVEWEAPSLGMPDKEFFKHRFVHCTFYNNCLNHAAGLHWPGWSCCWCAHNPYGQNFNKTFDSIEELSLINRINFRG